MSRPRKYDQKLLASVVASSTSVTEVLSKLGYVTAGGTKATHLSKAIKRLGLDTSHFKRPTRVRNAKSINSMTPDELKSKFLVVRPSGSDRLNTSILRKAMLSAGLVHECSKCKLPPFWLGASLVLDINHINGNPLDNSLSNLEFICPNCHRQTPNFGSKNRRQVINPPVVYDRGICPVCNSAFDIKHKDATYCGVECAKVALRRAERPSKEKLEELISTMSLVSVGALFGVSDNAVRKWMKTYGIPKSSCRYYHKLNRVVSDGRSEA